MAVNGINKSDLQKFLKWLKYSKFRGLPSYGAVLQSVFPFEFKDNRCNN